MSPIITLHSPRADVGKSQLTANLAYLLASQGSRVAVVDLANPSQISQWFGLDPVRIKQQWQTFLWQNSAWSMEMPDPWVAVGEGAIAILTLGQADDNPISGFALAQELREAKYQTQLTQNLAELLRRIQSDILLIETQAGFNEEAFLAIALSDLITLVFGLEPQDFQDIAVMVDLAHQLQVPEICLVASQVPNDVAPEALAVRLTEAYNLPILGLLPPLSDPPMPTLFCQAFPDHIYSKGVMAIAHQIITLLR